MFPAVMMTTLSLARTGKLCLADKQNKDLPENKAQNLISGVRRPTKLLLIHGSKPVLPRFAGQAI